MKRNIYLFVLFVLFIIGQGSAISETKKQSHYPKLAIYSTSPVLSEYAVERYAKFDLVVLDMENWNNNPEAIAKLREANPAGIILAYANPFEVYYRRTPDRKLMWELYSMVKEGAYAQWFFWTTKKEHAIFYTQQPLWMMNMSMNCPKVKGYRWNDYVADFLIINVLAKNPRPDGYFMDNSTADIHWLNSAFLKTDKVGWLDSDLDGQPDEEASLDSAWKKGQEGHVSIIRQKFGPEFIIVGNKGKVEYDKVFDGKMFEEFPYLYAGPDKRAGGWFECMDHYLLTGPYSIIQIAQTGEEARVEFGLASALMGDGYFAINHNNSKWWPVYTKAQALGLPLGPAKRIEYGTAEFPEKNGKNEKDSYWVRTFEHGSVTVWPYKRQAEIKIE